METSLSQKVKISPTEAEMIPLSKYLQKLRSAADNTGEYAGSDCPLYSYDDNRNLFSATITVYRMINNQLRAFSAIAFYKEFLPSPNDNTYSLWIQKPHYILAECAELLALQKAFPNLIDSFHPSLHNIKHSEMDISTSVNTNTSSDNEDEKDKMFEDIENSTPLNQTKPNDGQQNILSSNESNPENNSLDIQTKFQIFKAKCKIRGFHFYNKHVFERTRKLTAIVSLQLPIKEESDIDTFPIHTYESVLHPVLVKDYKKLTHEDLDNLYQLFQQYLLGNDPNNKFHWGEFIQYYQKYQNIPSTSPSQMNSPTMYSSSSDKNWREQYRDKCQNIFVKSQYK